MFYRRNLLPVVCLLFITSALYSQISSFQLGSLSEPINPVIARENVTTAPFNEGVLILNSGPRSTFIYYFDGEHHPVLVGETNPYAVSVGPVPGGHIISSSGSSERILQFISEADFSLSTLDHPYGRTSPKTVVFPDYLLQINTLPGDSLVITRIGGQPVQSTEIFRHSAFNGTPSYKVQDGRVIISTIYDSFVTDGTVNGTHLLQNHGGIYAYSIHFFNGEYFYWDKVFQEIVAMDPINGSVRRFMRQDFPSSLKPGRITDMTVTPAGIVYVARTDEYNYGLFLTDGTVAGSRLLKSFPEIYGFWGTPRTLNRNAPHPNGALIFLAEGTSGVFDELWQSDGTDAGTKKIKNVLPGLTSFTLAGIGRYDTAHSYFYTTTTYPSGTVRQLYGAELDEGDTPEFRLLEPDSIDLETVTEYVADGNWFLYTNPTDTEVGMRAYHLRDDLHIHYPGAPKPSLRTRPLLVNDQAFLLVETSETGKEPGVVNLGEASTTLLADVFPGTTTSNPHFFNIGESVFFLANNPESGYGIYRTDGTSMGTDFYADLHDRIEIQSIHRMLRIGDDLIVAEAGFYNYLLNEERDSLEAISGLNFYLADESVAGFFAFTYPSDGDLRFASRQEAFDLEAIFPNQYRITKPVVFGEEFAFLMAENFNEWFLAFVNPTTRTGRSIPLDADLRSNWSFNGMFATKSALYFYAEDTSDVRPFLRYDEETGLQRLTESLVEGESMRVITPGLKNQNTLIRTRIPDVGNSYWLHNQDTDRLIPQGLQLTDDPLDAFVTLSDRLLVMTEKQLYLTASTTDLAPRADGLLLDETTSEFELYALTYLFDGEMFFVRSDDATTELWQTDGTVEGTRKVAAIDGRPYSRSIDPMPQIQNWLLYSTINGEQPTFLLYNYQNGATVRIANNAVYPAAVGLGDRFYFIENVAPGGQNIFFLEEIMDAGNDGNVFEDINRNGVKDIEENGIDGQKARFRSSTEEIVTFSSVEGKYPRFYSPEETYEVIIEPDVCWEVTTDSIVSLVDSIATPDFGLAPRSDFYDLKTKVYSGAVRCGFEVPFWVVATNTGCVDLTDITVDFRLDEEADFVNGDIPPDEIMAAQLRWNNVTLAAGESWRNRILITMPDETRAGRIIPFTLAANGLTHQGSMISDTFTYQQTLRCAIDPNDKLVTPSRPEETNSNYTQIDETLTYTIRFQNTGNDTAINVRLEDQLAADLDLNTFKPVAASHDFRVELGETGRLKVYFDDIFLPDSNVNETASHGFFAFDIALKEESLNTAVENTAGIFFDFNAPVITNTVSSSIVEFLDEDQDTFFFWEECDDENPEINPAAIDVGGNGIDEDCDGEDWTTSTQDPLQGVLQLFPNPTSGKLTLNYSLPGELLVTLFDGRGRRMQSEVLRSDGQLDLSGLPGAVFYLQVLEVSTGRYSTRRVVKW